MTSCDTSFLHSLYLIDSHTQKARTRVRQVRDPEDRIALSPFHQYELRNSVRLSAFLGLRDVAAGESILEAFRTIWQMVALSYLLAISRACLTKPNA